MLPLVAAERDAIEIVEYDPGWNDTYAAAAAELASALAPWVVAIEHIGSTSVSGLAAKPIIDLQVGVRTLDDGHAIVGAVEALGYEYVPEFEVDLPERRYFRRWTNGRRTHHIHLVERSNTDWWDRHIAFRDWLRRHDRDRDRYAELKRQLATQHPCDRAAYTDGKTEFIQAVERRALRRGEGPTAAP